MKNKTIILVLIILFTISLGCGVIGLVKHNENGNKTPNTPKTEIKYNYYLEDLKVDSIPKNKTVTDENVISTTETIYIFKKYLCTNNLTGDFNTTKWEFVPTSNIDSTCDLYFVKAKYEVDLNVINGVEDEKNLKEIDRETDGVFKITPNEGYQFKEAICSNDKEASWDVSTNTLTLNAIMSNVACNVKFEKKELKIGISVTNGVGNTTESVFYGDSKSIVVEPKDGYNNPKINCTNDQSASFNNNSLSFEKVTNNSSCKVIFQKIPIISYNLIITNPVEKENVSIISGNEKQSIVSGKDGKITLKSNDGKTPTLNCGDTIPVTNILEELELSKTIEFTFYSVTKNITCTIGSN